MNEAEILDAIDTQMVLLRDVWDEGGALISNAFAIGLILDNPSSNFRRDDLPRIRALQKEREAKLFAAYCIAADGAHGVLSMILESEHVSPLAYRFMGAINDLIDGTDDTERMLKDLGDISDLTNPNARPRVTEKTLRTVWLTTKKDINFYLIRLFAELVDTMRRWAGGVQADQFENVLSRGSIQWNGKATELAYLLTELIEGNYIVPPSNGRKVGKAGNRAAVANAIYSALDIRDHRTGEPVSRDYFKSLLKPNSPDRGAYRNLFKIIPRPH